MTNYVVVLDEEEREALLNPPSGPMLSADHWTVFANAKDKLANAADLDTAVERGAQRLIRKYSFFEPSDNNYAWRAARAVLEDALTSSKP